MTATDHSDYNCITTEWMMFLVHVLLNATALNCHFNSAPVSADLVE